MAKGDDAKTLFPDANEDQDSVGENAWDDGIAAEPGPQDAEPRTGGRLPASKAADGRAPKTRRRETVKLSRTKSQLRRDDGEVEPALGIRHDELEAGPDDELEDDLDAGSGDDFDEGAADGLDAGSGDDFDEGSEEDLDAGSEDDFDEGSEEDLDAGSEGDFDEGSEEDLDAGSEGDFDEGSEEDLDAGSEDDFDEGSEEDLDAGSEDDFGEGSEEDLDVGSEDDFDEGSEEDLDAGSEDDFDEGSEEDVDAVSEDDFGEGSEDDLDAGSEDDFGEGSEEDLDVGSEDDFDEGSEEDLDAGSEDDFDEGSEEDVDAVSEDDFDEGSEDDFNNGSDEYFDDGLEDDRDEALEAGLDARSGAGSAHIQEDCGLGSSSTLEAGAADPTNRRRVGVARPALQRPPWLHPLAGWGVAACLAVGLVFTSALGGGGLEVEPLVDFFEQMRAERFTDAESSLQHLQLPVQLEAGLREHLEATRRTALAVRRDEAWGHYKSKDFAEALTVTRAIQAKFGRNDGDVQFIIAESMRHQGEREFGEAYQHFLTGFPAHERIDDAMFWLAEWLAAKGKVDEARANYQAVIDSPQSNFRTSAARRLRQLP